MTWCSTASGGEAQAVFGYLHRNHEKIAEGTTYLASIPTPTARLLLLDDKHWAYCLASKNSPDCTCRSAPSICA